MNLKESFRYQKFLDRMILAAAISIGRKEHSLKITKTHNRSAANTSAEDIVEEVKPSDTFYPNDTVIEFMQLAISEKEKLSHAISKAKNNPDFDVDAAIETNQQRQRMCEAIKNMLSFGPSDTTEPGRDYTFNAEGNQVQYIYTVNVKAEEAYNRQSAKEVMRRMIAESDKISAAIDAFMINTTVEYEPIYDVNDSFDDIMTEFMEKKNNA